jgi:hypothetical protein
MYSDRNLLVVFVRFFGQLDCKLVTFAVDRGGNKAGNFKFQKRPTIMRDLHYMAILSVGGMKSQTRQKTCISPGVPRETRMYLSRTGYLGPIRM